MNITERVPPYIELDLLRQRMHVAKAPFERRAEEDCRRAGRLIDPVSDFDGRADGVGTSQAYADACIQPDRLNVISLVINVFQNLRQVCAGGTQIGFPTLAGGEVGRRECQIDGGSSRGRQSESCC